MYNREVFWFENITMSNQNSIPGWARAEHLEMNVPVNELWTYQESYGKENILKRFVRLFVRKSDLGYSKKENNKKRIQGQIAFGR